MRSRLWPLAVPILLVSALLSCAPAALATPVGYVVVSSSNLNSGGTAISNATICFQPVNNNTVALPGFHIGASGGGHAGSPPMCAAVTGGAFTITVPDTALTAPLNVCYNVTVTDQNSGNILLNYSCVQPASTGQTSWCATVSGSTSCNFDSYSPSLPGMALQTTGPTGPMGPAGPGIPGLSSDGANGVVVTGQVAVGTTVNSTQQQIDVVCAGNVTTALQAAINSLLGTGGAGSGGVVRLSSGSCYDTAQITTSNSGSPKFAEPFLALIGNGGSAPLNWDSPSGTVLDLRYAGGPKIAPSGNGVMQISGLSLIDTTDGTQPFFYSTVTTLNAFQNRIIGKIASPSCSPTVTCQDAFILGGSSPSTGFGGYKSAITGNFFDHVAHALVLGTYANVVDFTGNAIWSYAGGTEAIKSTGDTSVYNHGGRIEGNLIEMQGYTTFFNATHTTNMFLQNDFDDTTSLATSYYNFDTSSCGNEIHDGSGVNSPLLVPVMVDPGGCNQRFASDPSQKSHLESSVISQIRTPSIDVVDITKFNSQSALYNGNFAINTGGVPLGWEQTADCALAVGSVTCAFSTGAGNFVQVTTPQQYPEVPTRDYVFNYTVTAVSGAPTAWISNEYAYSSTVTFAANAVQIPLSLGSHTVVFLSSATTPNVFRINADLTSGASFTLASLVLQNVTGQGTFSVMGTPFGPVGGTGDLQTNGGNGNLGSAPQSTFLKSANNLSDIGTPATALVNLGAATSIRSLPACTSSTNASNLPCMIYLSGKTAAVGGAVVSLPSTINGVVCTTTPPGCVYRITAITHVTGAFTGTSPTVITSIQPYNGVSSVSSGALALTSTSASNSVTATWINDLTGNFNFNYFTTLGGTVTTAGTYEVLILVE